MIRFRIIFRFRIRVIFRVRIRVSFRVSVTIYVFFHTYKIRRMVHRSISISF